MTNKETAPSNRRIAFERGWPCTALAVLALGILALPVVRVIAAGHSTWDLPGGLLVSGLFAAGLALHEAAHLLAAIACGGRALGFTVRRLGLAARHENVPRTARSRVIVSLSGPVIEAAYGLALVVATGSWHGVVPVTVVAGVASLLCATVNLVPLLPRSDGRRALTGFPE